MKYNFAAVLAMFGDVHRFDANETAFLSRELEFVRTRVFEVQYADLIARNLVPIANDIPASADTYVYKVMDRVGEAKVIANGAKDLPRVDVIGREETGKVRTLGDSYGWTVYELREAARTGTPLADLKARAARAAIETQIDNMLATGNTDKQSGMGVTGLINNADVEGLGITAFDHWVLGTTTSAQMVAELNAFVSGTVTTSKQKFIPDTLVIPSNRYEIVSQAPWGVDSDKSALRWFLENSVYIKNVVPWYRLTGAGASGKDRMIAMKRDPLVLEGVIPQEFEQFPPQAQGLEMVVNCTARSGGVKIYQPLGLKYADFDAT